MTGRTQIGGRQILDGSVKTQDIEDLAVTDDKLSTSGVGSGTYTKLTVNTKGRAVAGENPTTLAGYGITDAAPVAPSFVTVNSEITLPNERRLIGTADQVSLVDGGGNSTLAVQLAADAVLPGTGGVTIPVGTTAQRDLSPNVGEVRFNTDLDHLEIWDGVNWVFFKDSNAMTDQIEPTGFVNRVDSQISFDTATRTFTVQPTTTQYTVYMAGQRFIKTAAESVTIPNTTGSYYFRFNTLGTLISATGFEFGLNAMVAYVYWNAEVGQAIVFGDERHGITMDAATHSYLHQALGTQYVRGLDLGNFTVTGDGTANADAQFSLTNGLLFDEDIGISITHEATPTSEWSQVLTPAVTLRSLYKFSTSGAWRSTALSPYAVQLGTNTITFNQNSGGNWSLTEATSGNYVAVWIVSTNAVLNPVVSFIGQRQDASLTDAQNNNTFQTLDLTGFPFLEFRPLYRLIFQTSSAYTNAVKARLVHVEDIRAASYSTVFQMAGGGGVSDHSALSGLTLDDHPQYVHTEINRTISATHTFNPTSPGTPFTIGANALNTLVTGLNADLLDGLNASAFQPVDLDLTAIAALATTGFPARTAANTWALRTITGTAGNIAVANGAGIAGDPTINLVTVGTAGTFRSVTTDAFGRVTAGTNPTTLAGYGITDAQPLDSDLTALAGTATTGLYTITGTGTSTTRTATGTANEIVVTNGSGVAGNPTFSISPDPIIPGTGSISLPDGTTAQRPVTPVNGMIRYNTTLAATEVYQNNQWYSIGTTVSGGVGILAVYTGSIPGVSGTTTVPYDNTVPLSTEGSQIWTTVVTPSKTTSLMKFTVPFTVDCSTSNRIIIASLYRDTLNIGTAIWFATGGGRPSNITMSVSDEPGTVTPVTYSMRVGIGAGGGTWYVNSTNSGNDFGGALLSSYEITEVG